MMVETSRHEAVFKEIRDIILKHQNFYVLGHVRPDGDSVGSGLAMAMALKQLGKNALFISEDPLPGVFDFLGGSDLYAPLSSLSKKGFTPDVGIFLDCAGMDRAGDAADFVKGKILVNIDHHVSNTFFARVNLVDPQVSAAGELLYRVLSYMGVEIGKDIATCIYVAIATDTGGFRYQNTGAGTHLLAADLLNRGVDAYYVSEKVFQNRSLPSVKLLGDALKSMEFFFQGKVALIGIDKKMLETSGASIEDTDDIIDYPRSVKGVEVACVLKETDAGIQVSLRSKHYVDVAEIAVSLGGGGHARAAGVVLDGDINSSKERILTRIGKALS